MDDTNLVLDRVPVFSTFGFDREVSIVYMGKANGLLTIIKVKEPLLRFVVFVVVPVDLREHVIAGLGIRLYRQHARVEPDRKPSVI